ncbi:DNA alkylation repair enzyme [Peptoniphilus sp. ING2-D1G]|nr:DNA alkylation repair enzyme [Peptoniphilus sp. ING2-D1G]
MDYENIKEKFKKESSLETAVQMAAYMKNKFKFYGLKTPKRREIYKEDLKREKKNKKIDWDFLDECWADEHREFQYLVCDYLRNMKNFIQLEDLPKIERYLRTKQWWDSIDSLDTVVGSLVSKNPHMYDLMLNWSTDDNFWIRRAAINHQRLRKKETDTKLLERIILNNLGSDEFFINKAIGWSLREYSKTDDKWVRDFIEENADKMNKISIKEASKYL